MMDSAQLTLDDYAEARARREAAIVIVADHAEENYPGWKELALKLVAQYAATHRDFISEKCTDWAYENGLPTPHDPRALGQIYRMALKQGIIRKNGYDRSPKRASPTVLWRSCHPNFAEAA